MLKPIGSRKALQSLHSKISLLKKCATFEHSNER